MDASNPSPTAPRPSFSPAINRVNAVHHDKPSSQHIPTSPSLPKPRQKLILCSQPRMSLPYRPTLKTLHKPNPKSIILAVLWQIPPTNIFTPAPLVISGHRKAVMKKGGTDKSPHDDRLPTSELIWRNHLPPHLPSMPAPREGHVKAHTQQQTSLRLITRSPARQRPQQSKPITSFFEVATSTSVSCRSEGLEMRDEGKDG